MAFLDWIGSESRGDNAGTGLASNCLVLRHALLGLGFSLLACGGERDGVPGTSGGEVKFDWTWMSMDPVVSVMVVDDAPTPDAEQLRASVVGALRLGLGETIHEYMQGSCSDPDPAAWHPFDFRYIVARPSAPDDQTLVTPMQIPGMALTTNAPVAAMGDSATDAVTQALELRLAAAGETYRPLRVAKRSFDLLAGFRDPISTEEAEFRASLPKFYFLRVFMLSTRDDADPTPVGDLELPQDHVGDQLEYTGGIVVAPTFGADGGPSRISQWAANADRPIDPWPGELPSSLFDEIGADCGTRCIAHDIAIDETGRALCTVTVDQDDLDACDPARGWSDPHAEPSIVLDEYGWKRRRCEVLQLEAADLDECRHSLECPGCPSGWCKTQVPELLPQARCPEGQFAFPLRFVGGAREGGAEVHIRCQTAPF